MGREGWKGGGVRGRKGGTKTVWTRQTDRDLSHHIPSHHLTHLVLQLIGEEEDERVALGGHVHLCDIGVVWCGVVSRDGGRIHRGGGAWALSDVSMVSREGGSGLMSAQTQTQAPLPLACLPPFPSPQSIVATDLLAAPRVKAELAPLPPSLPLATPTPPPLHTHTHTVHSVHRESTDLLAAPRVKAELAPVRLRIPARVQVKHQRSLAGVLGGVCVGALGCGNREADGRSHSTAAYIH